MKQKQVVPNIKTASQSSDISHLLWHQKAVPTSTTICQWTLSRGSSIQSTYLHPISLSSILTTSYPSLFPTWYTYNILVWAHALSTLHSLIWPHHSTERCKL